MEHCGSFVISMQSYCSLKHEVVCYCKRNFILDIGSDFKLWTYFIKLIQVQYTVHEILTYVVYIAVLPFKFAIFNIFKTKIIRLHITMIYVIITVIRESSLKIRTKSAKIKIVTN